MIQGDQIDPPPIRVGAGGVLRLAQSSDEAEIRALFDETPMRGDLVVTTDRAPNFFSLYELQDARTECWVVQRDAKIVGCACFIIRRGWLGQKRVNIGYLGDLRATPRAFGIITRYYAQLLQAVRTRHQVAFFFAGIMDSNTLAKKALVERRKARAGQPMYHPLRHYDAVNIRFSWRGPPRMPKGWEVRCAQIQDIPTIAAHLHQDHKNRPMGYCFDQDALNHRLAHWPGYRIEQTYLAYLHGELQGLCTVWDAREVKRYRVHDYRGKLKWLYRASTLLAPAVPAAKLPKPGQHFHYAYLTNLSIKQQNPAALRALLAKIMQEHRKSGYHFLMAYIEQQSPLHTALGQLSVQKTPFTLYQVTAPDQSASPVSNHPTGFEIALA